jgi:hypothetical protein
LHALPNSGIDSVLESSSSIILNKRYSPIIPLEPLALSLSLKRANKASGLSLLDAAVLASLYAFS